MAVAVNAGRVDFDGTLDFSSIGAAARVVRHDFDSATAEEIVQRCVDAKATVLITKEVSVSADTIAHLPSTVVLICEAGTGFNNIDIVAARAKGITVCNVPDYSSRAVAQLVLAYALNHSVSMLSQQRMLAAGNRENFTDAVRVPLFELEGKTIGLVGGRGTIGSKVAELCLGLGMKVLVSSRRPAGPKDNPLIEVTTSLEHLLRTSDIVSLHCPLNEETKHLIDGPALRRMKRTAYLINTSRGGLVDQDALIDALRSDDIGGAALDVQAVEPPPADCPLYSMPNVCLTPHIGWKRKETRQRLLDIVAENITAFQGGRPVNVVNP